MAIQNASDLLVYKIVSSTTQITKISVLNSNPMSTLGSFNLTNLTNNSGTKFPSTASGIPGGNDGTNVLARIRAVLLAKNYTVSSNSSVVGGYISLTATNGQAGDVLTLGLENGSSSVFAANATIVLVTTEGEDAAVSPIGHSTSASISFSTDLRDSTTKDSGGFAANLGGLRSFELSTDAFVDLTTEDDNYDSSNQFVDLNNRTQVEVQFAQRATSGTNERFWKGDAFVSSLSIDAGVEENTTYSVTLTGTAAVTTGTD